MNPASNPRCHGVIADDLTGATDTAAAFAKAGFRSTVLFRMAQLSRLRTEVVVLSTNSRHDPPATAARKVQRACRALRAAGCSLLYKKMDSTLQGNIAAEVEALRQEGEFATVLLCPANPAQGRIVQGGILHVHGQKFADIPVHLASLQLRDDSLLCVPLSLAKVRRSLARGVPILLADARTDRDLALLVRAGLGAPTPVLLAGSAGLAAQLALAIRRAACQRQGRKPKPEPELSLGRRGPGPTLLLVGSNNLVTQTQVALLSKRAGAVVYSLADRHISSVRRALVGGRSVVVNVPVHRKSDRVLLQQLGRLSSLVRDGDVAGMVLSGGDTANLVQQWLRPHAMLVRGEIVPGLAWGTFIGGMAQGLSVCTKPGGFGDANALLATVEFFAKSND